MQLPQPLLQALDQVPGFDARTFAAAHEQLPPVSIRTHPRKPYPLIHFPQDGRIPWCADGIYLKERPLFTLDPGIHGGAYYVQEASSMFLAHAVQELLGNSQDLYALDLCAAPGGKSTLLASMPQFSLVLANEIIRTRVSILFENAVKWGEPKLLVSNNDPAQFAALPAYFDLLVVDAPCSGSGLFRKDQAALKEWSVQNVQHCAERQQRILADALPTLKEDGILVYSTCSYSPEEDEAIVEWLTQTQHLQSLELNTPEAWGIVETHTPSGAAGYRFFPDRLRGEGFFIACFRKGNHRDQGRARSFRYEKTVRSASYRESLKDWVDVDQDLVIRTKEADIFLLPASLQTAVQELEQALHLRKSGLKAGTLLRDQLIPDHELILSLCLSDKAPRVALSLDEALRYLRKQDILPGAAGKGWWVVTYAGLPLGAIKHLGNRVNNYYPSSWRILMS